MAKIGSCVERTGPLLTQSTNRSNFGLNRKTRNVPSVEIGDSQRNQSLKKTANAVRLSISTFLKYVLTTFATRG